MHGQVTIFPLHTKNLCYQIGGKRLIKDISFSLSHGTKTFIVGPNGAGKSLLMRLCHGLIKPTSGSVECHAVQTTQKCKQAMVFQRPVLLRRSVAGNIAYALRVYGVEKRRHREIIEESLRQVGLNRFSKHPARSLSFGEQQRLALARALALKPDILFLDEPTANLDPAATHVVEEVIEMAHLAGTKIIMTTHDLNQARRLSDDILFLYRGRLKEQAPTGELFTNPKNDLAQAFVKGELLWWRQRPLSPDCDAHKDQ